MKHFWVKGVLEKSLHEQVLISLGMEERPDAVERPWNLMLGTEGQSVRELPANTPILSVFDELGAGRTLLILGEPGSGKTITLLQLARDLIQRAEQQVDHLIPVVLNLSSWTPTQRQGRRTVTQSIANWVVEELSSKYQVPRNLGKDWVQKQQLLLLLDGLDEVKTEDRGACVNAINVFQQEASAELVVCCRVRDYEALSDRLRVQQAIYIQPLTLPQIRGYLNSLTANLTGLISLLATDTALQELAQSPLWLNIMVFVYEGVDTVNLPKMQDIKERQKYLFDQYVDRMFTKSRLFAYVREQKREKPDRYSRQETMPWLRWLAQQMVQRSQTVFLIERMQPSWLFTIKQKLVYSMLVGLSGGLIIKLLAGLLSNMTWMLIFIPIWLFFCIPSDEGIFHIEPVITILMSIAWTDRRKILLSLPAVLIGTAASIMWWTVSSELIYSLALSIVFGLFIGIQSGFINGLVSVLILLLFFRLFRLIAGLLFGLIAGLFLGLASIGEALASGIENCVEPNQGIKNARQNVLVLFMLSLLGIVVLKALHRDTSLNIFSRESTVSSVMLFFLLLISLQAGGKALLQHFTLRLILYFNGCIPWNYARFLDEATDRLFLQKVGGGYIFIHRLLMEHIAEMPLDSDQ